MESLAKLPLVTLLSLPVAAVTYSLLRLAHAFRVSTRIKTEEEYANSYNIDRALP